MNPWLLVLLICAATFRLTRLAIKDEVPIVKVPRDALIKFLDPTPEMIGAQPGLKGHWNGRRANPTLFTLAGFVLAATAVFVGVAAWNGAEREAAAVTGAGVLMAAVLGVVASGNSGSTLAYLLECPWCMSAYTGAAVVFMTNLFVAVPAPLLVWIAASTVTGLIANAEVRHDQKWELAEIEKRRALAAEQREARR